MSLAAMHFNENSERGQAQTAAGVQRYAVKFPKYKKDGSYIVVSLKGKPTYGK